MKKYITVLFFCVVIEKVVITSTKSNATIVQRSKLLAVVTLFRHGDRAPTKSFPNDEYFDETFWPMDHGQLTNKGKIRMYEVGRWFRKRYEDSLPQQYSPKEVFIRSTDVDRCLMSAYTVLAGLFPAQKLQVWNEHLLWQPIPVHAVPLEQDHILSMTKNCPRYAQLLSNTLNSKYIKKIHSKFFSFLNRVADYTGWEDVDVKKIATLQTTMDVYSNYNASFVPRWYKTLDKKLVLYLAGLNHQRYTRTPAMKKLLLGPFWYNLLAHFDNVVNNVTGTPKLVMLSGHDTTIVSLLNGMRVYDNLPPSFGSALIWELRKDVDNVYYINLLYKKSKNRLNLLALKKCGGNCEYGNFREIIKPMSLEDNKWTEECGEDLAVSNNTKTLKKPFYT